MIIKFDDINDDSRIWIFQSNVLLDDDSIDQLKNKINTFLTPWTAHGNQLKASIKIKYNIFLIIALDNTLGEATGCSIDKLISFIKSIEKEYQIRLLDRLDISYKVGQNIVIERLNEFKKKILTKQVDYSTIVFNNLIKLKRDMSNKWEVSASESWHKKLF